MTAVCRGAVNVREFLIHKDMHGHSGSWVRERLPAPSEDPQPDLDARREVSACQERWWQRGATVWVVESTQGAERQASVIRGHAPPLRARSTSRCRAHSAPLEGPAAAWHAGAQHCAATPCIPDRNGTQPAIRSLDTGRRGKLPANRCQERDVLQYPAMTTHPPSVTRSRASMLKCVMGGRRTASTSVDADHFPSKMCAFDGCVNLGP